MKCMFPSYGSHRCVPVLTEPFNALMGLLIVTCAAAAAAGSCVFSLPTPTTQEIISAAL